jgi:hypothetical protein
MTLTLRAGFPTEDLLHFCALQSIEVPFLEVAGAETCIDLLRLLVPIQTGPFHARAIAVTGELDAMSQERGAYAKAPMLGQHEDVFEVQRRPRAKR